MFRIKKGLDTCFQKPYSDHVRHEALVACVDCCATLGVDTSSVAPRDLEESMKDELVIKRIDPDDAHKLLNPKNSPLNGVDLSKPGGFEQRDDGIFEYTGPVSTVDFIWFEDEIEPDYILNHKGEELIELQSWDLDPKKTVYYNCDTEEVER